MSSVPLPSSAHSFILFVSPSSRWSELKCNVHVPTMCSACPRVCVTDWLWWKRAAKPNQTDINLHLTTMAPAITKSSVSKPSVLPTSHINCCLLRQRQPSWKLLIDQFKTLYIGRNHTYHTNSIFLKKILNQTVVTGHSSENYRLFSGGMFAGLL